MSERELKEEFVSNLNGTSLAEVASGSFLAPLCLLNRSLLLLLHHQAKGCLPMVLPPLSHLLLDFSVLVLPLVLSCTVLSDVFHQVIVSLACFSGCVLWYMNSYPPARHQQRTRNNFLESRVKSAQVPFLTAFRVLVNVKTAISILAVDFSIFPRRYAKTETYGTGVMDFGVGAYVFANALVCPEARSKNVPKSKTKYIWKQLLSVWPLVLLGMGRLASVKMSGYHEHVSEYGVHWNFFFTLAIVRVAASVLLAVFPVRWSWLVALAVAVLHQVALEGTGLKAFLLHDHDRAQDFLHANKEGIFSVAGYIAIYMAGVQVGLYVMRPRSRVREWLMAACRLLMGSFVLYSALYACLVLVEPVSRRMANFPFCLWNIAQSMFFLSCLCLTDVALLFFKRQFNCHAVPLSWDLDKKHQDSDFHRKKREMERLCLFQAVSRNQLLFFLFANVMTGLTNSLVDTLHSSSVVSLSILLSYMFTNCLVVYVLHLWGVTVKFW